MYLFKIKAWVMLKKFESCINYLLDLWFYFYFIDA